MALEDLIAEITGEKPPPPAPLPLNRSKSTTAIKRKADGDSSSNETSNKLAKQSQPNGNGQRSTNGNSYAGTATPGRLVRKPSEASTATSSKKDSNESSSRPRLNPASLSTSKAGSAKSSPTFPPPPSDPPKAPKKGSLAEIMARGAKAQQIAPKAGLIQHKPISSLIANKKEREEQLRKSKATSVKTVKSSVQGQYTGTASRDRPAEVARNGANKHNLPIGKRKAPSDAANPEPTEKKVKKAALARTGYTGTARPTSKESTGPNKHKHAPSRSRPPGGLLAPPRAARRDRYGDEDSDMDDFIDDDEGDEDIPPRGYRYRDDYDSDGSSDMEAGADDIAYEEQNALRAAFKDDAKEQALLEKLRREKEARKKRAAY